MVETDSRLLTAYDRRKDQDAFGALVERYRGMVYVTALRITRNPTDAEDIAQDCFLELSRNAGRVTTVPGWLHSTATHRAMDSIRRAAARRRHEARLAEPGHGAESAHSASSTARAVESDRAWGAASADIDRHLEELPDHLRLPLILHFLEGRTHQQVAVELKLDRSTVTRRLDRGVQELRRRLRREGVAVPALLLLPFPAGGAAGSAAGGLTGSLKALAAGALLAVASAVAIQAARVPVQMPPSRNSHDIGNVAAAAASSTIPPTDTGNPTNPDAAGGMGSAVLNRVGGQAREVAWAPSTAGSMDAAAEERPVAYIHEDPDTLIFDIALRTPQGELLTLPTQTPAAREPLGTTRHLGSLTWSPDGAWLLFVARNPDGLPQTEKVAHLGYDSNLWIVSPKDGLPQALTRKANSVLVFPAGIFNPRFAPDGQTLYWSEPVTTPAAPRNMQLGAWKLCAAAFKVVDGVPTLGPVETRRPGEVPGFYQVCDVAPNGRCLLLSATCAPGLSLEGLDLFEYDWDRDRLTRLTATPAVSDRRACYTADGESILWLHGLPVASAIGAKTEGVPDLRFDIQNEIWRMQRDGSHPHALTHFTKDGHADYAWLRTETPGCDWATVSDFSLRKSNKVDEPDLEAVATVSFRTPTVPLDSFVVRLRLRSPKVDTPVMTAGDPH